MPRRNLSEVPEVKNSATREERGTAMAAESEGAVQREQPASRSFVDLNFKVSPEVRRRFDRLAYEMDLKNIQILERAMDALERDWEREMSNVHVRIVVSIRAGLNPEGRRGPQHVAQRVREVLEQAFHPEAPADLQVELGK